MKISTGAVAAQAYYAAKKILNAKPEVEIDEDEGRGISPNRQDAVAALADDGNGR